MIETYYSFYADEFRHKAEIGPEYDDRVESIRSHGNVMVEEIEELKRSFYWWQNSVSETGYTSEDKETELLTDMTEEMADVLVTIHVMAEIANIDVAKAYEKKMNYNMRKTATKDDKGKVTDDAEIEKPDFSDCVGVEEVGE